MRSAFINHGITLQPREVKEVAGTMHNMDQAIRALETILDAYVTDHGPEILISFKQVVEGEIVDYDEEEGVDAPQGQEDEGGGVYSPSESQGTVDVLTLPVDDDGGESDSASPYVL